ncbi:WD40 repeat-like protein [Basidiobolus meristosporus CBS 931.73]|uniref:WD40 repeat-like protein n=1 Tax=Basidiobolus meristosporus CBS 931.73 TaxID=1314790 RepID=A0A1Y1Z215_9FUNG|nr:WD40 repeat-like protein [Basidiobolus meristosporus CBS 931.73]|eukprot:ORY04338.1 WD40 repeat-like protein [Basidiobolus meristosporus CBS 931.73]
MSDGIDLENLAEDSNYDFSESSLRAREEHQMILDEFERKRRARSLAVPTDDGRVRAKLRELGEPQCLFAEGPAERRDRLRVLLSKLDGADADSDRAESDSGSDSDKEEEFFTEGSTELLVARRNIAYYSLPRAKQRLARQRSEHETPLAQIKSARKELYTEIQGYANYSSQIGDDRPVSIGRFSPDSKILATGSWTGMVKLWNVPNCSNALNLRGHTDRVGGLAFHPQSTLSLSRSAVNLASGGADGNIHLWSLESETPVSSLLGHTQRVSRVGFHPSGQYLGSASFDGTWRLWNVETTQELLLQEGHSREVYAIAFQNDGALAATGGLDAIGRIWDLRTGRSAMVLEGHVKDILGIDFSPNGYQVVTGSEDNTLKIFDLRTMRPLYTIPAHNSLVSDVRFFHASEAYETSRMEGTPNVSGLYLASSSYDGTIKIWSADTWKLIKSLSGHEGKVMSVDIAADGNLIASTGFDRTFKLWANENAPF